MVGVLDLSKRNLRRHYRRDLASLLMNGHNFINDVKIQRVIMTKIRHAKPDMSNTIEGDIDIDFLGVLTLTIDIELVTFE